MDIQVSVITPLYKGMKYIPKLMEMLKENAKHIYIEYILVNDSPEEKLPDEEGLTKKYELPETFKLKVINNPKNMGIQQTRAVGLKYALSDYILFLDQDDELEGNALLKLFSVIKQKDVDVVVGNGYRCFLDENGRCIKQRAIYERKAALKEVTKEKMYIYGTDMILSPGQCLIKKSSIPKEWTDNKISDNGCDDFLLWLLMFQKGCSFYALDEKIYYHNETGQNYSASYEAMERSFMSMCDYLEKVEYYEKGKIDILRRRYNFKTLMKTQKGVFYKLKNVLKNLDVVVAIICYKVKGYY